MKNNQKIFVGIGSGAIQLGLWAYQANLAGMKIILCDVDPERINQIRKNKNCYHINIAHFDRIVSVKIGPVEIYNISIPEERNRVIGYIGKANDIVTAVPSTSIYEKGISDLLKEGLLLRNKNSPVIVYASENQIRAARTLEKLVFPSGGTPPFVQFCDTVIARMGGVQSDMKLIKKLELQPMTSGDKEAMLVEDFDKIIVEKEYLSRKYSFETEFSRFHSTDDIGLYEENKLFGHNAVHSLLGFIGKLKGYTFMSQYNGDSDFGYIGVDALREETGRWSKMKYKSSKEEIVTENGYESWVVQLCSRIVNPFLFDLVDRIIRDPERKLGWDDRLISIMRNSFSVGVVPKRYALGVASALLYQKNLTKQKALAILENLWVKSDKQKGKIIKLVGDAFEIVQGWKTSPYKSLWQYIGVRSQHSTKQSNDYA
ncbi:MAG: hypothetical protein AUJ85_01125 [Elusimicrobia bacterium CG1_02_37_114]|nr:MAG: hypothetical protein AUJ85_01125 [Elusimicrobia bacterium CG1_02_37_114]